LKRNSDNFDLSHLWPYLGAVGVFLASWLATRFLDKIAAKIKANHIFGGLLITTGQVGAGASGTFFYVWCWVIAPPNVGIAFRSPLQTALPIWAAVVEFPMMCLFIGFASVAVQANGIVKLAPNSKFARAVRTIPILRRFVVKGKRSEKASFPPPSYIQAID
jgi:hypothetical protein